MIMRELTRDILVKAGWYPERTVDTFPIAQALRELGFPVHSRQLEFLRQFGGITMELPHSYERLLAFDVPQLLRRVLNPVKSATYLNDEEYRCDMWSPI